MPRPRTRRGFVAMKGKQVQLSLYLPLPQYWLLRATSKRTGFSMQYLLRRGLEQTLKDLRGYDPGGVEAERPER